MTGWRIGWMVVPEEMLPGISTLIEYNMTCTPGFVLHAACHALEHGEAGIRRTVARLRHARDHLAGRLAGLSGVELAAPAAGAMYTFFRIDGVADSLSFRKQLVFDHGLGLAPGIAFGQEGNGYLRWCHALACRVLQ
jgi:aspartate/methionine/tyrosine aminotransferase